MESQDNAGCYILLPSEDDPPSSDAARLVGCGVRWPQRITVFAPALLFVACSVLAVLSVGYTALYLPQQRTFSVLFPQRTVVGVVDGGTQLTLPCAVPVFDVEAKAPRVDCDCGKHQQISKLRLATPASGIHFHGCAWIMLSHEVDTITADGSETYVESPSASFWTEGAFAALRSFVVGARTDRHLYQLLFAEAKVYADILEMFRRQDELPRHRLEVLYEWDGEDVVLRDAIVRHGQ